MIARIVALGAAALFVPLVLPLATGRVFTMDDLSLLHLPARAIYARALAEGDAVAWTSTLDAGYYLHGEGQSGMYHPLHVLLYSTLPLVAAFNLELIASYVFAIGGTVGLLRRWRFSPAAAAVGAIAFTFSGFNLFRHLHLNLVAVGAHLPWLLWAADVILDAAAPRARVAASIAFACALGSALLLGFPQMVLFCAIAIGSYAAWRGWRSRAFGGLAWLAAAAAAGTLLGAVQLLPTLDVLHASVRSDPPLSFRLSYSLHPLNLLQLVAPYVFRTWTWFPPAENAVHEFVAYNGAFCTLAVGWAIARRRHLEAPAVLWWALALAALATVLALGAYGGVYPLVADWPGFRWFRGPARLVFLLHFALSVVAAAVFDDLARAARAGPAKPATLLIAGLALAGSLVALGAWWTDGTGPMRATASVGIVGATAALMILAARGHAVALAVLPLCLALDLGLWGYGYAWEGTPSTLEQVAAQADLPPAGAPGDLVHSTRRPNLPVLSGYRVFEAYVGLSPLRALEPGDPLAQRLAGVRWRWTSGGWARVDGPMPRARLVTDAMVFSAPWRGPQSIAIDRIALVDAPVSLDNLLPGLANVAVDRPGRIVVDVSSPGRALLVTTERHHEGWHARAGGRELPIVRVYGEFLACVVEQGPATVTLTFEPRSLTLGRRISLVTLLGLALGGVYCLTYFFSARGPTSAP